MAVNLKLQMVELPNVVVVTIDQGLEDEGWQFGLGRSGWTTNQLHRPQASYSRWWKEKLLMEKLYTLLMVDPDVPNLSQDSSTLFLKDQLSVRKIDEPIYGEERNVFEKFRGFINLPSRENIDKNVRLRRMGPRKRIEDEKLPLNYQHPCMIPWKLADKTGLLYENDPEGLEDGGFGRMGIDLHVRKWWQ
ncbi:hypothetical protein PPACK8108_LOCUS1666 [Phakopsora pachyrhizi]|uniref:Uncharacterized protein n=1 Tax=Phakopsora pachyrhizi TaxID=170000 RepID=A0AAV0AIR9_PHAPC|nr:hypothetical protein PPACK8108_LOCUS1666 [Phakopsora pachyrhizi]